MKRIIPLILSLVMGMSLCACGNTAVNGELVSLKDENSSLEATIQSLNDELISLKADFDEMSNELNEIKSENTKLKDENSSLEATIQSLNDKLILLKADFDEMSNELNEIKSENTKLKDDNSSLEATTQSLKKELDVYKKAEEQAKKDKEVQVGDVTVTLSDKGQLPKNTDAWRFSNYVTFVFEISNNTDKDIQGVQGVATFNDLFGKKIISMNCDFTGKTIPAGGSITVDSLTFEVNQFMSDHTKLYTTDYKDLKFEYQTTSIVFTDGTSKN